MQKESGADNKSQAGAEERRFCVLAMDVDDQSRASRSDQQIKKNQVQDQVDEADDVESPIDIHNLTNEEIKPKPKPKPKPKTNQENEDGARCVELCSEGVVVRRVKRHKLSSPRKVYLKDGKWLCYHSCFIWKYLPKRLKSVEIEHVLDVRSGFSTDNLHCAATKYSFREHASETTCFSVVLAHNRFVHKSLDFVAEDERSMRTVVGALGYLVNTKSKQRMHFDEKRWLVDNFKKADQNGNGKLTLYEVWKLLKRLNLQISEDYAKAMFMEADTKGSKSGGDRVLDEEEFLKFFERLTHRPDLEHALRMLSSIDHCALTVADLQRFLTQEQQFDEVDDKKAESIIDTYEAPNRDYRKKKLLGPIGFRRLLQSRWGNILKAGQESVCQDMDRPLSDYFVNSSHNTYLTGLQMKGEATVEGYISALKKGARLLELDIFDGDHGEPCITHKRTLITSITLRNALKAIDQYAFANNPYPVILTIENHVGLPQQKAMARILNEVLGDKIYKRADDAATSPLPSPNALKRKYLLRGKKLSSESGRDRQLDQEDDENLDQTKEKPPSKIQLDPAFSSLISLPSVKISSNIYQDIKEHPMDGSASLSETKVQGLMEGGTTLTLYTATRFVKSYPKGLRQDSSNMDPMPSWLVGVQSVAMNMQTPGDYLDLVFGLFTINGGCGFVLKPECLLGGLDPRLPEVSGKVRTVLSVGVISGQYLPKPTPGNDVIDPYVMVEVYGIAADTNKFKTKIIRDNGFNPQWNETFEMGLRCPELALLRLCVKDFDSTSANDFVGEFTVPVNCIRAGYSHVRLNTGYGHTVDESASLLIRIAFDD